MSDHTLVILAVRYKATPVRKRLKRPVAMPFQPVEFLP